MKIALRTIVLSTALLAAGAMAFYAMRSGAFERVSDPNVVKAEVDALIDALESQQSFSGVVVIARGNRVLFSRASGAANRATGQPMTLSTAFQTSSMGKMLTSMVVHRLAEERKLDLDASVSRYLPDAGLPNADRITIRQLLTHTSGYGNHFSHSLYEKTVERGGANRDDLKQMIRETPVEFEPGVQWRYSNAGYVVLGWVVEAVVQEPFEAVIRSELLTPLGAGLPSADAPRAAGHRAITSNVFYQTTTPSRSESSGMGDGGWMLTASSLHSAATALSKNSVPGVKDWHVMLEDTHELRSHDGFTTVYGAGLMETRFKGLHFVGHDGSSDGWSTDLRVNPEDGMTFVVLSNNSEVVSLDVVNNLIRMVYGLPVEIPTPQRKAFLVDLLASEPTDVLVAELDGRLKEGGFDAVVDPMPLIEVAEALQRSSFNDVALKAHRLNMALFPDASPAHGAYGEYLYWVEKSPERALAHFRAMLVKFPGDGYATQRIDEISKELEARG